MHSRTRRPRAMDALSPRWRKVWRDVWLHKARTALVVAAIVVGIVGSGTVLDTWALLRRVTRDGYLATKPAAATIRFDLVDSTLLARVRALPAVRAAVARRTVVARIQTREGWRTAQLFAGEELATSEIGVIAREQGVWPPIDGSIVLEHSSLDFAGLALGDTVRVQFGEQSIVSLPAAGVARDASLPPGWMEHVVYSFVTPATLAQIGASSVPNEIRFTVRGDPFDREAIRRVALEVTTLAEQLGRRVDEVDVPVPGRHMHAGQMDSLLYTQGAFGVLSLLLSALLVVNLVTAMLTGQMREIGIMKAIGARASQLAGMYLVMAAALGALASIIAVPIAAFLGYQYAAFGASLLNFDVTGYRIPAFAPLVQVAVGLLLPVVAAAVPVWRGARVSVNAALREAGGGAAPAPRTVVLRNVSGLGRPLLLSLRNAFRRRQRMAFTLITLALGGAVYLGALGLRSSIRESVSVLFDQQMKFDIVLRVADPIAAEQMERTAQAFEGVARAEAWGGARATVARADGLIGVSFPVTGLPANSEMVAFPVVQGGWLVAEASAPIESVESTASARAESRAVPMMLVNKRLLGDEPTLSVGREVALTINGQTTTFRIGGVVESGPAPNAYVSRATLARVLGDARVRSVVVASVGRTPAARSELVQRLRDGFVTAGLNVANTQLVQANRASVEDHLLMVSSFLLALSQLTILVGGLGLASTMSLAVLERTREIGVLRAIGASHSAILTMLLIEALVIGLCSWLVAIPLSMPVRVLLSQAFGRIMMPVPIHWEPDLAALAFWLLVVVVVSLVASVWPARRALRITTAAALAHD